MGVRPRGEARRRAILEAALRLLGREGGGAVTHRSVAKEASVPLAAEPFLVPGAPVAVDVIAQRVTTLMAARLGDDRHTMLIQYELGLEAARRPELQPMARAWTAAYAGAAAPALAALGSTDPETDAWILVTSLEGIEFEALASGEQEPLKTLLPCVRRLLGALVLPS